MSSVFQKCTSLFVKCDYSRNTVHQVHRIRHASISQFDHAGEQNHIYEVQLGFCSFIWSWNLVAYTEGGMYDKGFWEYGAEEDIWA
jgi:hypothetical protein